MKFSFLNLSRVYLLPKKINKGSPQKHFRHCLEFSLSSQLIVFMHRRYVWKCKLTRLSSDAWLFFFVFFWTCASRNPTGGISETAFDS